MASPQVKWYCPKSVDGVSRLYSTTFKCTLPCFASPSSTLRIPQLNPQSLPPSRTAPRAKCGMKEAFFSFPLTRGNSLSSSMRLSLSLRTMLLWSQGPCSHDLGIVLSVFIRRHCRTGDARRSTIMDPSAKSAVAKLQLLEPLFHFLH